jgi:hypothetical protein
MNMQKATIESPGPVMIPESIEECFEMLGHLNLVGLGDFAREAGFEEPVLVTEEALKQMVGEPVFDGQPELLIPAVVQSLHELRDAIGQFPVWLAPVVVQKEINGQVLDILVRQNHTACPPYTLVTLE